jgi:hypothetical protein
LFQCYVPSHSGTTCVFEGRSLEINFEVSSDVWTGTNEELNRSTMRRATRSSQPKAIMYRLCVSVGCGAQPSGPPGFSLPFRSRNSASDTTPGSLFFDPDFWNFLLRGSTVTNDSSSCQLERVCVDGNFGQLQRGLVGVWYSPFVVQNG